MPDARLHRAPVSLAPPAAAARVERPWIESARFDLAFFILSPLVAVPMLLLSPTPSVLSMIFACGLGVPHYLSTFTFFFWDETMAEHRARWPLFFGVPVIIVACLLTAVLFRIAYIVQVTVYVWNVYHVARQGCGIQSIYRMNAGVKDPSVKSTVNPAIVWTSAAMAFYRPETHPSLRVVLPAIWERLPRAIFIALAFVAVLSLVRLGQQLLRRSRSVDPPRMPEMLFLGTSLLLFHPYLWVRDSNVATLGMLVGHFIQYLAMVWLVHRRKFMALAASGSQSPLARLSTSLPLLLFTLLMVGGGAFAFNVSSRVTGTIPAQVLYSGGLLAIALVHFYLDGLFWAFRRPEVRRTLTPYLMVIR